MLRRQSSHGFSLKSLLIQNGTTSSNQGESVCVRCCYPGSDIRVLCLKRCTYHARCIDLISIANSQQQNSIHSCPHCALPSSGLEILPLSFDGMDQAQRMNQGRLFESVAGHIRMESEDSRKRSNTEMDEGKPSNSSIPNILMSSTPPVSSYSQSSSQCYDPNIPRTGRWTDEELAFRDSLISHFLQDIQPSVPARA